MINKFKRVYSFWVYVLFVSLIVFYIGSCKDSDAGDDGITNDGSSGGNVTCAPNEELSQTANPEGISVSKTGNDFKVSWKGVQNASYYYVYLRISPFGNLNLGGVTFPSSSSVYSTNVENAVIRVSNETTSLCFQDKYGIANHVKVQAMTGGGMSSEYTRFPDVANWNARGLTGHIYFPSYARYRHLQDDYTERDGNVIATNGLAYDLTYFLTNKLKNNNRINPIISFAVIGDGNTVVQGATATFTPDFRMPLNRPWVDDQWGWTSGWYQNSATLLSSTYSFHFTGTAATLKAAMVEAVSSVSRTPAIDYGLAIGGWPQNGDKNDPIRNAGFRRLAQNTTELDAYIDSLTKTYRRSLLSSTSGSKNYNFPNDAGDYWGAIGMSDIVGGPVGSIHIDWEFPENATEASELLTICQRFKSKLPTKGISLALGSLKKLQVLNLKALNGCADYFELMTYDFSGVWSSVTGHHTPLYDSSLGYKKTFPDLEESGSVNQAVTYLLDQGIPASKILIGVALYGRLWNVTDTFPAAANMKPYFNANAPRAGNKQQAELNTEIQAGSSTIVLYHDIVNLYTPANGWVRYWDESAQAPYLIHRTKNSFISYDDEQSIQAKIEYAKKKGLHGVLIWDAIGARGIDILDSMQTWLSPN